MDTSLTVDQILNTLRLGFGKSDNKQAVEELLGLWVDKLGATTECVTRDEQCVRFETSIPTRLRGLGHSPVLILGEDSDSFRNALSQIIRDTANGRVRGIVLCLTDAAFRHLRTMAGLPTGCLVCLSRDDVRFVLSSDSALTALSRYIRNQLPFKRLIPFSTSEPAVGSMFVGRKNELEMLIEENQDFALCGSGGMGKTSLLRQMQWVMKTERDPRHSRVVEVNLLSCESSVSAAAQVIAKRVCSTSFAQALSVDELQSFFRRMRTTAEYLHGPIDLVIDEIDTILGEDRKHGYPLMKALRQARQADLIRLTISGRTETEKLLKDENNPFTIDSARGRTHPSRIKLIELVPLTKSESADLLFSPLSDLGVQVDSMQDDLSARLADCAGVPYAIQNLGLDVANSLAAGSHSKGLTPHLS